MKPKKKSLAELRDLASAGAEVTDKDGIGVRFAEKTAAEPAPAPQESNAELAGALDRFALSLNVLLASNQTATASIAEAMSQLRSELERMSRKEKPASWVFDVKKDGSGNMTITASPK